MDQLAINYHDLQPHPFADLLPMIGKQDFDELVEDIGGKGLLHAIVIFQGMILDGRNRHKACRQLVEAGRFEWAPTYHFKTFTGDEEEALAYVESLNINRRHLTKSQRAISAAKMYEMRTGKRPTTTKISDGSLDEARQAAEAVGVSVHSLLSANVARRVCPPHIIAMVEQGQITLSIANRAAARLSKAKLAQLTTPERVMRAASLAGALRFATWQPVRLIETVKMITDELQQRELTKRDLTPEDREQLKAAIAQLRSI